MADQQIRESLAPRMNRRAFLARLGIAAESMAMGTRLSGLRAFAGQPAGAEFTLRAPEPHPKYGRRVHLPLLSMGNPSGGAVQAARLPARP
jgi:hypothetical protein